LCDKVLNKPKPDKMTNTINYDFI